MKVFEYINPKWGKVFHKISMYLRLFAPEDVRFVDYPGISDVQIIHVIGLGELEIISQSNNFVIWQHCYKTAGDYTWDELWEKAIFAASFHNLRNYSEKKFNFLHLPLGVDFDFYKPVTPFEQRPNIAFVTGHIASDECIDTVYKACKKADFLLLHTGENFKFGTNYFHLDYMPERDYADLLSNDVKYVFGLRKVEGFELSALEGVAAGCNAVVPTIDTYDWYDELAIRLDVETTNLEENIYNVLKNNQKMKINGEKLQQFSWKNVITKFWNFLYDCRKNTS
jgi:glycosyltransferase involved in cell wall biosynthesis